MSSSKRNSTSPPPGAITRRGRSSIPPALGKPIAKTESVTGAIAFIGLGAMGRPMAARLVEAGFADPVMDQEMLRLSFSSPKAAIDELRGLGANADRGRFAGLRTPAWRARLHAALEEQVDAQGRCVLEFEIVYGHAFRPERKLRVSDRTEVGLDEMKWMLSRRRGTGMSR